MTAVKYNTPPSPRISSNSQIRDNGET